MEEKKMYEERRCQNCGRAIPLDARICPYCSIKFEDFIKTAHLNKNDFKQKKETETLSDGRTKIDERKKEEENRNRKEKKIAVIAVIIILILIIGSLILFNPFKSDEEKLIGGWRVYHDSSFYGIFTFYENGSVCKEYDYDWAANKKYWDGWYITFSIGGSSMHKLLVIGSEERGSAFELDFKGFLDSQIDGERWDLFNSDFHSV